MTKATKMRRKGNPTFFHIALLLGLGLLGGPIPHRVGANLDLKRRSCNHMVSHLHRKHQLHPLAIQLMAGRIAKKLEILGSLLPGEGKHQGIPRAIPRLINIGNSVIAAAEDVLWASSDLVDRANLHIGPAGISFHEGGRDSHQGARGEGREGRILVGVMICSVLQAKERKRKREGRKYLELEVQLESLVSINKQLVQQLRVIALLLPLSFLFQANLQGKIVTMETMGGGGIGGRPGGGERRHRTMEGKELKEELESEERRSTKKK